MLYPSLHSPISVGRSIGLACLLRCSSYHSCIHRQNRGNTRSPPVPRARPAGVARRLASGGDQLPGHGLSPVVGPPACGSFPLAWVLAGGLGPVGPNHDPATLGAPGITVRLSWNYRWVDCHCASVYQSSFFRCGQHRSSGHASPGSRTAARSLRGNPPGGGRPVVRQARRGSAGPRTPGPASPFGGEGPPSCWPPRRGRPPPYAMASLGSTPDARASPRGEAAWGASRNSATGGDGRTPLSHSPERGSRARGWSIAPRAPFREPAGGVRSVDQPRGPENRANSRIDFFFYPSLYI